MVKKKERDDGSCASMDGPLLLINALMGALKRQAAVSLGAELGPNGETVSDSITPEEVRRLMLILAAQGLKDVIRDGMLGFEQCNAFSCALADEMERTRSQGKLDQ